MIVLPSDIIVCSAQELGETPIMLLSKDGGDVFVHESLSLGGERRARVAKGIIRCTHEVDVSPEDKFPPGVEVMIQVRPKELGGEIQAEDSSSYLCNAWVVAPEGFEPRPVSLVRVDDEIFARLRGLYETDALRKKTVLIVGLGSGGSTIAVELAKSGVANFILVDHDRLEVGNVVRHVCGLTDLGRFKTKAVSDCILDKNPSARVETHEVMCDWGWLSQLQSLMRRVDIAFCSTDNRTSRVLVNLASIRESRVCIYGGTFNRAYGGHVLRVIPGETMCYQCFIDILPDKAEDQEISSEEQAQSIAYDDRPVPIEPGLSNDIAPVATMCVKLGILELLRGTATSMASLYDDLHGALYQWLNRREKDTQYASLTPLDSEGSSEPRILAWYGIFNDKDPGCPACGNFIQAMGADNVLTDEEISAFGSLD
jgi:molybdopterin/thiamine biosynthesis adenylyltransferase